MVLPTLEMMFGPALSEILGERESASQRTHHCWHFASMDQGNAKGQNVGADRRG